MSFQVFSLVEETHVLFYVCVVHSSRLLLLHTQNVKALVVSLGPRTEEISPDYFHETRLSFIMYE